MTSGRDTKVLLNYEGIRFVSDKQAIVFDIGTAYTKFGFAGEHSPRGIIKTEVCCPETKESRKIFDYENLDDLYESLVEFFHLLFFRYTQVSPKDQKIICLESPLMITEFRNILAKVLFRHFEVGSLMVLPSHLVTICTLGIETALVLDVGYEEATVIPIYEGVPILKAWQALPLAARSVHKRIREYMKDVLKKEELTEQLVENIKVQTCFVTTAERAAKLQSKNPPLAPANVKYYTTRTFEIPGAVREKSFEIFWERDNDNLCIPSMILDSLLKCPIDARYSLAGNIVLVGGSVMAKGFTSRLKNELHNLVTSDRYCDKLKFREFKFHSPPCKPNFCVWLGGSIFGIADLPSRCTSKEKYLETGRIPDWNSLLDNLKEDNTHVI